MPNYDQHIRPGETVHDFVNRMFDAALEKYRLPTSSPAPAPTPEADSFEKIQRDFPDVFGPPKTGG